MPYLDVVLSTPPEASTAGRIAAFLTLLSVEVLHKKRELTAIAVRHVTPGHWFIGGLPVQSGAATVYVEIRITTGTNTAEEKAAFVEQAFDGLQGIIGTLAPASYVVIREVPAGSWGYGGRTQEHRRLSAHPL